MVSQRFQRTARAQKTRKLAPGRPHGLTADCLANTDSTFPPSVEGVMVWQKDVKIQKYHELDLGNLHVIKTFLSMKSRWYVFEVFSW